MAMIYRPHLQMDNAAPPERDVMIPSMWKGLLSSSMGVSDRPGAQPRICLEG